MSLSPRTLGSLLTSTKMTQEQTCHCKWPGKAGNSGPCACPLYPSRVYWVSQGQQLDSCHPHSTASKLVPGMFVRIKTSKNLSSRSIERDGTSHRRVLAALRTRNLPLKVKPDSAESKNDPVWLSRDLVRTMWAFLAPTLFTTAFSTTWSSLDLIPSLCSRPGGDTHTILNSPL